MKFVLTWRGRTYWIKSEQAVIVQLTLLHYACKFARHLQRSPFNHHTYMVGATTRINLCPEPEWDILRRDCRFWQGHAVMSGIYNQPDGVGCIACGSYKEFGCNGSVCSFSGWTVLITINQISNKSQGLVPEYRSKNECVSDLRQSTIISFYKLAS